MAHTKCCSHFRTTFRRAIGAGCLVLGLALSGFASLGWSRHAFRFEREAEIADAGIVKVRHDIEVDQLIFQLGLSYALSHL